MSSRISRSFDTYRDQDSEDEDESPNGIQRFRILEIQYHRNTAGLRPSRGKVSGKKVQRPTREQIKEDEHPGRFKAIVENMMDTIAKQEDSDVEEEEDLGNISQAAYLCTCRSMGVIPASLFYKSLRTAEVRMRYHHLGPRGAKACCTALLSNISVKLLDFTANDLDDNGKGASYIAEMLKENLYIASLTIAENNLGTKGAEIICEVLKDNKLIKSLSLEGNKFNEQAAPFLADLIENNATIKELNLSHNKFGEEGGLILADGLRQNDSLESLDFSWNHLRQKGAAAIASSIQRHSGILKLNLAWNGLYEYGCKELGKTLSTNYMMTELDVTNNRIDYNCLKHLLTGLKSNESLKILLIGRNPITMAGAKAILEMLEQGGAPSIIEVDIRDQAVDLTIMQLLHTVRDKRQLYFKHGTLLQREGDAKDTDDFDSADPMMVLMECMEQKKLRLVDLFIMIDRDGSKSLTHQEFKEGLMSVNVPMSSKAIDKLVKKLDDDGDGEVDFGELMAGQKEFKRRKHNIKKDMESKDGQQLVMVKERVTSLLKAQRMKEVFKKVMNEQKVVKKKKGGGLMNSVFGAPIQETDEEA